MNEEKKSKEKTTKQSSTKNYTLLQHIAKIVELSSASELNDEFFEKASKHINALMKEMNLTQMQIVLFSAMVNSIDNYYIGVRDLANHFKCQPIRIIQEAEKIEDMINKGYIVSTRGHRDKQTYSIPFDVMSALQKNEVFTPPPIRDITIEEFFDNLERWFEARENNEMDYNKLIDSLNELFELNIHLKFVKDVNKFHLSDENKILFCCFCSLLVEDNDEEIFLSDFEDLYTKHVRRRIDKSLRDKSNELFDKKLIENSGKNGFLIGDSYKLTDFSKREILSELDLDLSNNIQPKKDLTLHDSIVEKELFYNEREKKEINLLTNLLEQENFESVRKRLEENGMRKGFACLFYGSPGTGKTETVNQLAKQTGRHILPINVSQIKSMWVGGSEKNIKDVFVRYKKYVEEFDVAPILLFNEADAVFGIRREGATGAVDKMENSIQNIILEEMENLDGIMIATTNLSQNLDKAFERRFIYKIEFDKPCLEAKQSIWKVMIPTLTDSDIQSLSTIYDFSGGQIENIARKYTVHNILTGNNPSITELHEICKSEVLQVKNDKKRIGY